MDIKNEIFKYVKKKYKTIPEYLWRKFPNYAIFRHSDNKKWFGLIMDVEKDKLGLTGKSKVYILNIKIDDTEFRNALIGREGYFKGYHISRGSWITVLLDGTVNLKEIYNLIDISFLSTASKKVQEENRKPLDWIVPANPKYYDIEHAFDKEKIINWKQGKGIKIDDIVYIYVAAPTSAILYKCKVIEINIPYDYKDKNLTINKLMKIKLMRRIKNGLLSFEILKSDYSIRAIRGPIKIKKGLFDTIL